MRNKWKIIPTAALLFAAVALPAAEEAAAEPAATVEQALFYVDNLWVLIGGMLVFLMHLGFATVESGLCRAKNCTNILFKNTLVPAIGFLTYAVMGFSLMYPGDAWQIGKVLGFAGFGMGANPDATIAEAMSYNGHFTYWADFFFQGMFAATAATIVSGAVAERVKVKAFLVFTLVYVMLVYPVIGSWGWGGGWLAGMNFHDFAGSTFVHSVGGWAALAGVILLGPRIGKYVNGRAMPIMGHSMPLATIGVFCLWLGWFGFNGGSILSAEPTKISFVLCTTMFGASAGVLGAMLCSMFFLHKPDLSMTLNGCLAGLVAITAGADCVSPTSSIIIGLVGGVIVVPAVLMFDRLQLDDPVGALSVHLVNGIWGTLAVGIFAFPECGYSFWTQLVGVLAVGVVAFPAAFLIFWVLKHTMGIRVSEEEELRGLDLGEHGMEAYPGFQFFSNQ
ncbi:ammonium transporter [uncultured Victivallis sp.]|uniref:ammonium transporter n=1 Tax=uncultured Victivallis sp. TaxID=354118 RepID=UPI0025DF19A0|nr:ammonium transporter [uncultured Victivallis sp.]